MQKTCKSCSVRQNPKVTLVPEVFGEAANKTSVTVALNLTSMQLTAVKYVTWVITLLTNHRGVIRIPPIRNEGHLLTLLKSYWCGTISQLITVARGFLSLPRNRKKTSGTLGRVLKGVITLMKSLDGYILMVLFVSVLKIVVVVVVFCCCCFLHFSKFIWPEKNASERVNLFLRIFGHDHRSGPCDSLKLK